MKPFTTLLTATALTLAAGFAQADVRPDHIPGLLKSGAIADFEKLNQAALAKHPGATITDTELDQVAGGGYVYEVELTGTDGVKWEVKLDAKTAAFQSEKKDK
ncbi:peptidase M4 [Pseudomonas gingeri NCPPB 3146 = LMG 5327]|uniref:PepSY domain-containing protein n=2 Tax=Pseudomonas gingeri TaxID=117681 RepID=A0A7Y8CFQ9_9PSED|nr:MULTISPECIES: PepSY domain-containing protein [Pseudomonas]NVZ26205.1 PepSY domain-containing protein [Pseudomonas gingeri]NVZ66547.1 PepSY domain-containing protein [Pseudomonas gingeri]NVZ76389.1 PepSY domain-containing protein [Pseudomonas gingeri]NWA08212.1 PepSY domain-containing protein [Pseudomonas gingeri]NWC17455.1 PepSY domain-containing protein [Pseudomonas gingeri]